MGFSLIETLVVIAIIALFAAISFASFSVTEPIVKTATNALINTLNLARSYGIKHNTQTVFCIYEQLSDGEMSCLITQNWHDNWLVFADDNLNNVRDEDETILLLGGVNLSPQVRVSLGNEEGIGALTFSANGRLNRNNTFDVCLRAEQGIGQAVTFSTSGRYRVRELIDTEKDGC